MISKMRGMILLTTISIIMVLTLLVLSLMQGVLLYVKQSGQYLLKHDELLQLENAAQKIIGLESAYCVSKETNPNQIIEQLNQRGCIFNDDKKVFRYLTSELGDFPCIKIGEQGSRHRLITLSLFEMPQVVLQLRLAMPIQETICEPSEIRSIQKGIISWRYLS